MDRDCRCGWRCDDWVSMDKKKTHVEAHPAPEAKAEVEVATVCSVCGQPGNLTGSAGAARWHEACEASHPNVIAKVKARA